MFRRSDNNIFYTSISIACLITLYMLYQVNARASESKKALTNLSGLLSSSVALVNQLDSSLHADTELQYAAAKALVKDTIKPRMLSHTADKSPSYKKAPADFTGQVQTTPASQQINNEMFIGAYTSPIYISDTRSIINLRLSMRLSAEKDGSGQIKFLGLSDLKLEMQRKDMTLKSNLSSLKFELRQKGFDGDQMYCLFKENIDDMQVSDINPIDDIIERKVYFKGALKDSVIVGEMKWSDISDETDHPSVSIIIPLTLRHE